MAAALFQDPLWYMWDQDVFLRNRGRELGRLTAWPDVKTMGVASMKACSLNVVLLEHTAKWWVVHSKLPSAIGIKKIRAEASDLFGSSFV